MNLIMTGVREYAEKMDVGICDWDGRLTISAKNEGGHNGTNVDLLDLLEWVQRNMPTLIAQPAQEPVAWEQFYPDIGKPQIACMSVASTAPLENLPEPSKPHTELRGKHD